ncbi:hypothetical protein O6H91_03G084900 [Diphasiastrum complanatum]|uniref:Uncharacterized protein n=1 Tax=Diphasiastrum complanatum TaxID=34168 RepID=A0ACC2E946_DIPCM|nr:hypothetical protein O6H91_03G084900 [Diphasiastrum complanatum]
MADQPKLLCVLVCDENVNMGVVTKKELSITNLSTPARYTRPVLQSTLQLMGCKPRHAFKISKTVFKVLRSQLPAKSVDDSNTRADYGVMHPAKLYSLFSNENLIVDGIRGQVHGDDNELEYTKSSETYKQHSMVVVGRETFLNIICDALAQYRYVGPHQKADLMLACRVRERKTSMTILLCGTSGCGKSTLSSLLASRLGITTVVSTDSIRHMMRSFTDEKENPLLWASTYHAGECLDLIAVKEAKQKKRVSKRRNNSGLSNMSSTTLHIHTQGMTQDKLEIPFSEGKPMKSVSSNPAQISHAEATPYGMAHIETSNESESADSAEHMVNPKTMAIQGFKAQSEMVIDSLDRLITSWEQKCEPVVIEGVHLSLNFVMGLMRKHPSIIPFMVYIANEEKHLERFAVRAKYMTLDPAKNKYVKYIRNIRTIQDYLCKRADKHLVPMVNNTNVDKSVAAIHATIFSSLRRREAGEPLYDQATNTVKVVDQEYRSQYAASALGSKCMFQVIQRRGSSHDFMALMNVDGSVAKAWPVKTLDTSARSASCICSESGVLSLSKAEHVNLQFGNYGLSAFPSEVGETSYNGSADGQSSRGEGTELHGSRRTSSCSSSPRHGEGAEKELIEEVSVSVSEEEPEEDMSAADTDEELGEFGHEHLEEFEDEDDDGYWSDKCEEEERKSVDVKPLYTSERLAACISLAQRNEIQSGHTWPKIYPSPDIDVHKVWKDNENHCSSEVALGKPGQHAPKPIARPSVKKLMPNRSKSFNV